MEVIRMCICCRKNLNKKELVRVVKSKDGNISLDPTGKMAGRGAYVCRDVSCLAKLKKGALNRAFKCSVSPEIVDALTEEIVGQNKN